MAEEIKRSVFSVGSKAGRRDEFTAEQLPGKWTAFKATFSCGMSKVLIASLFCVLFCTPAIAWVVLFSSLFLSRVGASFPYGIFDGLGYAKGSILRIYSAQCGITNTRSLSSPCLFRA